MKITRRILLMKFKSYGICIMFFDDGRRLIDITFGVCMVRIEWHK